VGCYKLVTYHHHQHRHRHRHRQIDSHALRNSACEFTLSVGLSIAICFVLFHFVRWAANSTPAAQGNHRGVTHTVPATLCLQKGKAIGNVQNSHVYK
jgi:integral membrane sensor domain MASE1